LKQNFNSESFHQRYSELSDEIRAKNKREDRLLEVRLKYYEREKAIRLNILHKEQHQLELTRSSLIEQFNKIQQDRHKQLIPSYIPERPKFEPSILQQSTPELCKTDWESNLIMIKPSIIPMDKTISPTKIIRPHSAG
jgi:hypothetical protein